MFRVSVSILFFAMTFGEDYFIMLLRVHFIELLSICYLRFVSPIMVISC